MELKLTAQLYQNHERIFGPGIAELLERVQEHRSLRAAAISMEMAYSKAWRIVRTAEQGFGCKLLDSTVGGSHGGGAVLTPEAKAILATYRQFQADVTSYAQTQFQSAFQAYLK